MDRYGKALFEGYKKAGIGSFILERVQKALDKKFDDPSFCTIGTPMIFSISSRYCQGYKLQSGAVKCHAIVVRAKGHMRAGRRTTCISRQRGADRYRRYLDRRAKAKAEEEKIHSARRGLFCICFCRAMLREYLFSEK
jgi:hypothetical protein